MDTKWKKSRCAVSALCFVLGLSLLLAGAALALYGTIQGGWSTARDALTPDYQNTAVFRSYLSSVLQEALLLEPGEDLGPDARDLNLRYRVKRGGLDLCSNFPAGDSLPEEYNFLLIFDGEKVTITKDGAEIDVYGDGYYREGDDWYVPGFVNYPVEAGMANRRVTLAAIREPVSFTPVSAGPYTSLYQITRHLRDVRTQLVLLALIPAAGLALFIVYLVLRKAKAQADRALAKAAYRVWLEIKLALLIPLLALGFQTFIGVFRFLFYGQMYFEIVFAPAVLWWCYLYVNDLRYNGLDGLRRTLCGQLIRAFRADDLRLPVQKRLQRRAVGRFLALLPFVIFCAGFALLHWRYPLFVLLSVAGLVLLAVQALALRRDLNLARELGLLAAQIENMAAGDFGRPALLPEDADLGRCARQLCAIQLGLRTAVDEQMKSERMKVELIANVSHDIKTPLTSIISYAGLLSQEEGLPDHVQDYIRILSEKAERLKVMVWDVFEVSKAASGNLTVRAETLDLGKLLRQTLADMAEAIDGSGLTLRAQIPEEPVPVWADGDRLYRVFQNLLQNALKYSLPESRVYLTLRAADGNAETSLKNTSRDELPAGVDFTERFVRGDESRTDGGSGLGLSIARTFTEACGGAFRVETDADLFTAVVTLPLSPEGEHREARP